MFSGNLLQGGSGASLQGSGPSLQGSSPGLQVTVAGQQLQPAVNPMDYGVVLGANTTNNGNGTGTGSTAPVDPYSPAQHTFLNSVGSAVGNIGASGAGQFKLGANSLRSDANNILSGYQAGQSAINQGRENNELNRLSAGQDLLSYIRQGLHQGAARIASMNAMESSAPDALA